MKPGLNPLMDREKGDAEVRSNDQTAVCEKCKCKICANQTCRSTECENCSCSQAALDNARFACYEPMDD